MISLYTVAAQNFDPAAMRRHTAPTVATTAMPTTTAATAPAASIAVMTIPTAPATIIALAAIIRQLFSGSVF